MLVCGTCGKHHFKSVGGLLRHYLRFHDFDADTARKYIKINNPIVNKIKGGN